MGVGVQKLERITVKDKGKEAGAAGETTMMQVGHLRKFKRKEGKLN